MKKSVYNIWRKCELSINHEIKTLSYSKYGCNITWYCTIITQKNDIWAVNDGYRERNVFGKKDRDNREKCLSQIYSHNCNNTAMLKYSTVYLIYKRWSTLTIFDRRPKLKCNYIFLSRIFCIYYGKKTAIKQ